VETLKIGLEWFLNPDHLPLLIGLEKGWFREMGLAVDLVEPSEHMNAMEAIDRGTLDLAVTEPVHLVEDRAAGREAVGIARFLHTNGGVMYLKRSGIQRPRDMRGARVQYPGAPGPGGLAVVRRMIEADGGSPGDLVPVNRGFLHTDALVEGAADVATLAFYNFEVVEAGQLGHPAGFFALKDWGIPDFCQLILVTSGAKLSERRDALKAFLRVMMKGLDFVHQNPAAARSIYFRQSGASEDDALMNAIFDATVPCFTFDFGMSADYYRVLVAWMKANDLVSAPVEPPDCFTNQLVL